MNVKKDRPAWCDDDFDDLLTEVAGRPDLTLAEQQALVAQSKKEIGKRDPLYTLAVRLARDLTACRRAAASRPGDEVDGT